MPNDGGGSWKNALPACPVHNLAADVRQDDEGKVRVTVKARRPWFLVPPVSWIVRPRLTRTLSLDRIGSRVWNLCDGRRTIENIADEFASVYRLTFHEARASVTGYITDLVRRGALVITVARP